MSQTIVLNCPNCATRFSAPAEKFLPNGRQVRCSQCQHVWFNAISSDTNHIASPEMARTAAAATAPAPAPAPATSSSQATMATTAAAATASAATVSSADAPERTATADIAPPDPEGIDPKHVDTRPYPQQHAPKRRGGGFWSLLLWLIALCLLAAILTYIFREPLRSALPQAAPYIDRYTNTVDHTAQGLIGGSAVPAALKFQNIHYDVKEYDGEKTILVEADLVNTSDEAVPAPKVHVRVVDTDSAPMQAMIIGPEDQSDTIAPNQTTRYFARIPEPPADFDRVLLNIEEE